jgi:alkylated DNA repair dioxygenase AlkB
MQAHSSQRDLFAHPAEMPEGLPSGFRYQREFVTREEEQSLAEWIATLDLKPYEFRGYQGLRRVVSFGARYDYDSRRVARAPDFPAPLLSLRERAALWAGHAAEDIRQILVSEYSPGAPIGWHQDRPQFGDVIGVSLLAPSNFRLRRAKGKGWERKSVPLQSRSIYLLSGEVREQWQHSIPPLAALRYSITLRTLAQPGA